ncbi:MAG: WbuC family cupin fold metalloprotein [Campylobacterales bacterium]|nr:WbuC family cupin fold metalloprotein [Campylobacterales bacterium]
MIDLEKQNKVSEEAYFSTQNIISIDKFDIDALIDEAKKTKRNRVRFCSHTTSDEKIHEMFIVHPKDAYVRPHKHIGKIESMLVLHGEVDYITFNDDGEVESITQMGDFKSGKVFYKSLRDEQYHSMVIKSDWLVFLEITEGPFERSNTVFAQFAPNDDEPQKIDEFLKNIG